MWRIRQIRLVFLNIITLQQGLGDHQSFHYFYTKPSPADGWLPSVKFQRGSRTKCPLCPLFHRRPTMCCRRPTKCYRRPTMCCRIPTKCYRRPNMCCRRPTKCYRRPNMCCRRPTKCYRRPTMCCRRPTKCYRRPNMCSRNLTALFRRQNSLLSWKRHNLAEWRNYKVNYCVPNKLK